MEDVGSTLSQRILSSFNFDSFEAYFILQSNYYFFGRRLETVCWRGPHVGIEKIHSFRHNSKHDKVETHFVNFACVSEGHLSI